MSATPIPTPDARRLYGLLMVTAGSVLWSTAGLFVRLLGDMDLWTMQVWRSLFAALSLFVLIGFEHGRRTPAAIRGIGLIGWVAVPISAVSMMCYTAALQATSVANVMIVYATVPLLAAGIAWLWIGEAAGRRTLIAAVVALAGIAVMAGGATAGDMRGNALALLMTFTFALLVVMARRHPDLSMAVVNALAAALTGLVCMAPMHFAIPDPLTLVILAGFGVATTSLAYLLFLIGARHIPSGEAGLLGLLDTVLSPLWVWLAFSETPARAALLGGGLVLASVVWYLAGGRRGAA